MTIVDTHCHTFNADDLPVRGFIERVTLDGVPLGSSLAQIVDFLIQGAATDWRLDMARVDALLQPPGGLEVAMIQPQDPEQFEREVDQALAALQSSRPATAAQVGAVMMAAEPAEVGSGEEALGDLIGGARRAVRWVKLFGRSRLDLAAQLVRTFDDEVDLFTPLLVDLGTGLGDVAKSPNRQQVVLYEKISRLSMMGRLPGVGKAHFHFFVGFDPLRELRSRQVQDIQTPMDLLRTAIEDYGFIGVKLYPQMGWRPSGNRPRRFITPDDAACLDSIVVELVEWCAGRDVPIVAHCSSSNYADDDYEREQVGQPAHWQPIVDAYPELHLNLGHFGGADLDELQPGSWPWQIAELMTAGEWVFADVGNHRVDNDELMAAYFTMLQAMRSNPTTQSVLQHLMYGSDWFMEALHPASDAFLDSYRAAFDEQFGDPAVTEAFMGGNALRFLGFDDPSNENNLRLRERYERFAPDQPPSWLAG